MPWQIDSPSPVPTPMGLVVKKASKMRARSFFAMPQPVSRTSTTARPPASRARGDPDALRPRRTRLHRSARVREEIHEDLRQRTHGRLDVGVVPYSLSTRTSGGICPAVVRTDASSTPGRSTSESFFATSTCENFRSS